jgi:hypothetical protein
MTNGIKHSKHVGIAKDTLGELGSIENTTDKDLIPKAANKLLTNHPV